MTKSNVNEQVEAQKELKSVAEQNGLHIVEKSMEMNESGMDFRVAFAANIEEIKQSFVVPDQLAER